MFDLGVLQTAAPATQPAPLLDATAPPDALETGAAFDAALAATLALVAGSASRSAPAAAPDRIAEAEGLLGFTMAPAVAEPAGPRTADGAADERAPGAGEGAGRAAKDAAEAGAADASPAAALAVAGDLVAPAADVGVRQQPVQVAAPSPAAAGRRGEATGSASPRAAATPTARASGHDRLGPGPAGAAGDATPAIMPPAPIAGGTHGSHVISASTVGAGVEAPRTSAMAGTSVTAFTPPGAVAAAESAPETASTPAFTATANGATRAGGAGRASGVSPAGPAMHAIESAAPPASTASSEIATPASASPAPSVAGTGAMREEGRLTGAPSAPAAGTGVGRSDASAARPAAPIEMTHGHDAAASDGGGFSQGEPRQSPDFLRFAAALAQVAPARTGDGAAAAQAVTVAPVPAAVAASPAAAGSPVAPLMPPAPADTPDAENVGRLVQAMRVSARAGVWEATVRLKPEHLGEVTIALRVDRNVVSAVVNAEAAGVRQWLEAQEQTVRSGMAEHGLQLERFLVQRDGQRHDAQPQEQQRRRPRPQPQEDASARFEVVV